MISANTRGHLKKHFTHAALWICAGVLVLVLINYSPWGRARQQAAAPTETAGAARRSGNSGVEVEVLILRAHPLAETLQLTGTLRADESIDVQAETAGKITEIAFTEGRAVRRGDLLVKINDSELRAARQRAIARREIAELKARRLALLVNNGGVNQQESDTAQSEFAVQEAEVQLIQAQLDKTEIRAPFDSVIGLRFVSVGSLVTPSTRIASLQSVAQLKLDFSVPERHAVHLTPGATVEFSVSGGTQRHVGKIYAIEPRVDEATRTVLVRALVDNAALTLRPGALAEVSLPLQPWPDALLVPAVAILTSGGGKAVFVVEDGKAKLRPVVTGLRQQESVQLTSGVKAGDLVVIAGVQQLKSGTAVRVGKAE